MLDLAAKASLPRLLLDCRRLHLLQIARRTPNRVLIGHPFNPPHLIPLTGIVLQPGTEDKYTEQAFHSYQGMGKKPIGVKKRCSEFVANRIQNAISNQADSLVLTGTVTAGKLCPCRVVDVCMVAWLMV